MKTSRREFLKANAIAAAASAAGVTIPIKADAQDGIRWDKAACRFCGTGCSVLVGTQKGRVVATQADPEAEVAQAGSWHGRVPPAVQYHEWRGRGGPP